MPDLVALTDPPGPAWADSLMRWWDAGAAVLPVDDRLPPAARADLLDRLRPTLLASGTDVSHRPDGIPVEPGDALVMATSGTTGDPKGVILTHDAVRAAARATNEALAVDPSTDRWIACLPLAHVGGLGVVTRALLSATPVTILQGFSADAVTTEARRHNSMLISLVATALRRVDPTLFRVIVLGGDVPPDDPPPNAKITYGLTETMGGCVYDGVPLSGTIIEVTSDGEVLLTSPSLARAYRDGHTERPITSPFPTGDSGRLQADGRLVVDGRLDDVIVTGGEKVWPGAVEAVLGTHPKVRQVAIIGRPDAEWGHRVVAVVVPADPDDPPTLSALRAAAAERLPAYALPKESELTDSLPTTALGKLRRRGL
jgi:O-succinylbenzoic acid--CoA ligase